VVVRSLPGNVPIAWTGDGAQLASGRFRSVARLAELRAGGQPELLALGRHRVRQLAFVGADRLAALSGDRDLGLWDLASRRPLWTWAGGSRIERVLIPAPAGAGSASLNAACWPSTPARATRWARRSAAASPRRPSATMASRRGGHPPSLARLSRSACSAPTAAAAPWAVDREARLFRFAADGKRPLAAPLITPTCGSCRRHAPDAGRAQRPDRRHHLPRRRPAAGHRRRGPHHRCGVRPPARRSASSPARSTD
jgi:hypothetical protein